MSNMSVAQRRKIKGMTLLEVIIVLGIMGVIAAGVVILAQRAIDSQNITKLSQSLNTIQTAMVQSFRGKANYPVAVTEEQSNQLRTALVSMGRASANDFINPFTGDNLAITSIAANGQQNKAFLIRVGNLSQEQCRAVVSGTIELFSFAQVTAATGTPVTDLYSAAVAGDASGLGVIKSPGSGVQFDVTELSHITTLCGNEAGGGALYNIFFGSR